MNGRGYRSFLVILLRPQKSTEVEGFIFLESEDHRSIMGGGSLADESSSEMVIEEVAENFKLGLRERIHRNDQQRSSFFQINLEISAGLAFLL